MKYGNIVNINDRYILVYRELGYKTIMIKGFDNLGFLNAFIDTHKNNIEIIRILDDAE